MSSAPAVLVMARTPRRGEVRQALEPMLGQDGCVALQTALIKLTLDWAWALSPRAVYLAHEPANAGAELRLLAGANVHLFPQNGDGISGRIADGVGRVSVHGPGPIVIVWPDLPALRQLQSAAVLADLEHGVDLILGPVFDGGYYLIGLTRPLPELFALPERIWRAPDAINTVIATAAANGLQVGMLRAERALRRPADLRAALADPLLPPTIAKVLGRR